VRYKSKPSLATLNLTLSAAFSSSVPKKGPPRFWCAKGAKGRQTPRCFLFDKRLLSLYDWISGVVASKNLMNHTTIKNQDSKRKGSGRQNELMNAGGTTMREKIVCRQTDWWWVVFLLLIFAIQILGLYFFTFGFFPMKVTVKGHATLDDFPTPVDFQVVPRFFWSSCFFIFRFPQIDTKSNHRT